MRRALLTRSVGVPANTGSTAPGTDPGSTGGSTAPDVMFANFDNLSVTPYGSVTTAHMQQVFNTPQGLGFTQGLSHMAIVNDGIRNYLRQEYVPNAKGSPRTQVAVNLGAYNELYMSFRFHLEPNFEFSKGGKMHGLGGGTYPSGGTPPAPGEGFSWRHMWRFNSGVHASYKRFEGYAYHSDMTQTFGDEIPYGPEVRDPALGVWHTLTQRVKLNTGTNFDAVVQTWFNGVLQHTWNGRLKNGGTYTVDKFRYATFYGGDNSTWSPSTTTHVRYRDFKIATAATGVDGVS